jgi:transposase
MINIRQKCARTVKLLPRPTSISSHTRVKHELGLHTSVAEAARRNKTSETSVSKWKAQFLDGGRQGLAAGSASRASGREQELEAQIAELHTALGEAHVQLRVWKKSAEGRLAPSRTSR